MNSFHVKYRPKLLDDVLGQDVIVRSLKRVVGDKRAHAFIFTGPSGCGKTTLARILMANFIGVDGTLANVEEVNAASASGVDDCRAIIRRSSNRAIGKSPVRAFIIDEAHRLSSAAWTVFLKPIEEASSHTYWAFCTTEAGKIPKTIQTRCLKYDVKPLGEDDLLRLLVKVADAEKLTTPDDIIELIAESAGGSPRQALVYLEACAELKLVSEARQVLKSAAHSQEVGDLCRFLVSGRAHNWAEAMKYLQSIEHLEAESVRITVCNYISTVLIKTKDDKRAAALLCILEPFLKPYYQSDRQAPLLHSLGLALGLDGG